MAIMGVQGNLLQLFASADKKVEDFLLSLKQGDILKGKVLELFANDNRALINFKGYNVVSQLPQANLLQKGDIISVVVSQMGDTVLMKLINEATTGIPTIPQDLNNELGISGNQLLSLLNTIQVPVNEQNVFIAQRMIDYQVPITKENLNSINTALEKYITNNGIDAVQSPASVKQEVLLALISAARQSENGINIGGNISDILANVNSNEISWNTANSNFILNLKNIDDNFIKNFVSQALLDNIITQNEAENIINTLITTGTANVSDLQSQTGTLGTQEAFNTTVNEGQSSTMNTLKDNADSAIIENDTKLIEGNDSTPAINKQSAKIAEFMALSNTTTIENDTKFIEGNDSTPAINKQSTKIAEFTALTNTKAIENNTNLIQSNSSETNNRIDVKVAGMQIIKNNINLQAILSNVDKIFINSVIMTSSERDIISQIQTAFDNIEKNMHLFNNTNIKEMLPFLNKLNNDITTLYNKFSSLTNSTAYTQDLNKISSMLNKAIIDIQNASISSNFVKIKQTFADFIDFAKGTSLFKTISNTNTDTNGTKANTQQYVQLDVDLESAIESLVFLKSRNIPIENEKFIDTMAKYFKNDMKLNQGLERLSDLINKFNDLSKMSNEEFTNNIKQLNNTIKNLINEISVKLQDNNLKQENVTQQIQNFIDKSGLNIESRLKEALLNISSNEVKSGTGTNALSSDARENMKSMLIKLMNELNNTDAQKQLSTLQKDTLNQIKDASNNILNNMNALQLINQKPAAFDMIYTQIPIFSGNKLFNGEIQVWYRKGSIKENFKNSSAPVNIVFLLNTSSLGNVKISLSVFKNDVQCSIKTENEKAKQILTGGKNNFIDNLKDINFNIKGFNIDVDKNDKAEIKPLSDDSNTQSGTINFKA